MRREGKGNGARSSHAAGRQLQHLYLGDGGAKEPVVHELRAERADEQQEEEQQQRDEVEDEGGAQHLRIEGTL